MKTRSRGDMMPTKIGSRDFHVFPAFFSEAVALALWLQPTHSAEG